MNTANQSLPARLLFLLLCALGGCSEAPAPVLQVELFAGLPMDTGRIDIIVTRPDMKFGTAMFFKDGENRFTVTTGSGAPPSTTVALDLPLGTSGSVAVRAEARVAMPPVDMQAMSADLGTMSADLGTAGMGTPDAPAADASGCGMATIVPGTLTKLSMMLMMPARPCTP